MLTDFLCLHQPVLQPAGLDEPHGHSVTQKAAASAKRIFDILDHVSSVPEPAQPVHLAETPRPIGISERRLPLRQSEVIRDLNFPSKPAK